MATADGVGTKLLIASEVGRHSTIGIDLVAMCVNDLIVQGAEPLLFLDYMATSKLNLEQGEQIISGIADACVSSGCALVGGETAEMPGLYNKNDYDLAGFALGAVERGCQLTAKNITSGDIILGLASSGLHSNGFSLVRKIIKAVGVKYEHSAPFEQNRTLGDALLEPTKLYVSSCLPLAKTNYLHGLAHITGGGLRENISRILPTNLTAEINTKSWQIPPVMEWLIELASIPLTDAFRTFNMGIGMVLIIEREKVVEATRLLEAAGETVYSIGKVVDRDSHGHSAILHGI